MPRASLVLLLAIALAIGALGALASWDERREQALAIDEISREQTRQATGLARVVDGAQPLVGGTVSALLASFETPGTVRVLLATKDGPFRALSGSSLPGTVGEDLAKAATTSSGARLTHEQSASLGLPPRLSVAGFARLQGDPSLTLAVVTTALPERDRQIRAEWRLTLGFFLASTLVVAFGWLALRKQRAELALAHELAVGEAVRTRDERLVRADKLATMGALATGVAHEVSTPLGVIVGRAEQISRALRETSEERSGFEADARSERARLRGAADAISEQAERISRIIRGLLDLARGTSPPLESVAARELARAAADLVEHRFRQAEVELESDVDEACSSAAISCDPRLFEQVLVNLLLNACEASPRGGKVSLSVSRDAEAVCFCVRDEGEGISPEASRRATEPFFTTKGTRGTGLGLSIAREIVLHHRGALEVARRDDAGGRGTRACVHVPEVDGVSRATV